MPEAPQFLAGFNLINGNQIGGYTLVSATSTHESIKRYQEYQYHITLIFRGGNNYQTLYHDLLALIQKTPVIYGVRNPYRCNIDPPLSGDVLQQANGDIVFHLLGHSHRI